MESVSRMTGKRMIKNPKNYNVEELQKQDKNII